MKDIKTMNKQEVEDLLFAFECWGVKTEEDREAVSMATCRLDELRDFEEDDGLTDSEKHGVDMVVEKCLS